MNQKTASTILCGCGCGKITPIASETRPKRGWVKGKQMPFYPHHTKNKWPMLEGQKQCRKCLETKPSAEFWTNNKNRDRLQNYCKSCSKTAVYSYRTTHDGHVSVVRTRHKNSLIKYRVTQADYAKMLSDQDGLCAICGNPETSTMRGFLRRLCIDHCHVTGKVRGLLCSGCNHAIGKLGDDPAILRRAADYLEAAAG